VRRTDEELLGQVAASDRDAMQALYSQYADRLMRFAYSRLNSRDEAEDAVQETMIAVWERAASYQGASSPSTWLFGICRNKVGDVLRKRRPAGGQPEPLGAGANEEVAAFWEAFGKLGDEQRELILLVFHYGFAQQEVAEILGVPVGTVKSRVHTARRRLQALLSEGEPDG
jgi:RNA polymerase sigma-70 factor, ECF subfamily